jgi:peptidyl-prolyl cis-trans isomerase D
MVLQGIREKATGWIAWVIVILISIPFALWGINSYITPDPNPAVAKVGDYKITVQEFQNAVQNESEKLKSKVDTVLIKQLVLEKMINNQAMINYLSGSGLTISKEQIDHTIRTDEIFQEDGKFSEELYNRFLPSAYSKSQFRSSIATKLLLDQFSNGLVNASFVSDQEVKRVIQLVNQKRDLSYIIVKKDAFLDTVQVSDEEINNYYQNFQKEFENPEQVQLSYLEISRDEIANTIPVEDQEIQKYYDDNLNQYTQPQRRRASHILFTIPADADDTAKEKVKAEAQSVLDKVKAGDDFAELAKQHSKDPGSASNGGDLGFFSKGEMVPAFEETAYALKEGEISELVETPFGFHIIKLTAIQGGAVKPLAEVKNEIIKSMQFEKAGTPYFEQAENLQTMAFEQPDSLDGVANELNMKIKQSPLISRQGGEGIFANEKLLNAAFSELVLEEGSNSDLIQLGDDHVVVIRVTERVPASVKPLETVKDAISLKLKREGLTREAQAVAAKMIAQLKEGKTMEDVAQAQLLKVEYPGLINRQTFTVPADILQKAFSMARDVKHDATTMSSGDVALVTVSAIEDGDANDKVMFDSIKSALVQNKGNLNTALSVLQIRSESNITINKQHLVEEE